MIVDEASLAGTRGLHAIAEHAATLGAKVLLVGDWAQLAAVNAGGALQLLARDRDDVPQLTDVRRFTQPWEADASLQLRDGNTAVLDTYTQHDRLHDGDSQEMLDAAYTAWQTDVAAGRTSLLIAPTREHVTALNSRARAGRIATGDVDPSIALRLRDGSVASPGDVIVTRRNDRRATTSAGRWVRNGDRWTIIATHPDGTLTVQRYGQNGTLQLPADYVAAHVELGYATTAHRAQGATVDTAHTLVTAAMTREAVYVAMTRGRHANHAYVCTDTPDTEPHQDGSPPTPRLVLTGVLGRTGAEPSAHEAIAVEQDRHGSIAHLAAEYETIAATAQRSRWTRCIHTSGLSHEQVDQILASDTFGPLTAALRRAEAHHLNPDQLLPQLVDARPLNDVDDVAAILQHRLDIAIRRHAQTSHRGQGPRLVAGLIPHAAGLMADDMRTALDQRQQLIQQRAVELARTALANREPWTRHVGPPPADPQRRRTWSRDLITVAAYRDRHAITSNTPLGDHTPEQHQDTALAIAALRRMQHATIADQRHVDAVGHDRRRPLKRHGPSIE